MSTLTPSSAYLPFPPLPPVTDLITPTQRHPLHLISKRPPIIRLQLSILNPLLCPVLMQPRHQILRMLEIIDFIPDAFLDEDATSVLRNYRLFVLCNVSI